MLTGWARLGAAACPHLTSWMRSQHNHFSQPFRVKWSGEHLEFHAQSVSKRKSAKSAAQVWS
jgi:hypothetical protein